MKKTAIVSVIALAVALWFILGVGKTSAEEAKVFKWRTISVWSKGVQSMTELTERFIDEVKTLSQGQLQITFHGAGELSEPGEVLDMVSAGTVEMGIDWPNYWSGKNTAFDLLGSNTLGFTSEDYLVWIYAAGGFDLYQEIYGKYNCVYFPFYTHHQESGIRSNKPINKLSDLKGMKIRMAGLVPGKVLQEFGAIPAMIHVTELYEAMRRGTIDGFEYSTPAYDKDFHAEEISKYWVTPGWHQSSSIHGFSVNKDAWNSLPDLLKKVVTAASMDCILWSYGTNTLRDAEGIEFFKKSVTITRWSEEDLAKIEKVKNKAQEELAAKNPDYAKVAKSQYDYLKRMVPFREIAGAFGFGRNPAAYPDIK